QRSGPFVALNERVAFHNPKSICCRKVEDIPLAIGKKLLWSRKSRLQKPLVSNARGSSVLRKLQIMDRVDDSAQHPVGLFHCASFLSALRYFFMPSRAIRS